MVHEGLIRYGLGEVVNTERLQAYVANGLVPEGLVVDVPAVCEGLAEVVTGDGPYRTPIQDQAPWVDLDNPDTFDFAGVLPLEVTGVDDTTRAVSMTPTVRDGALPGSARRGQRTVGVSALLVARTTEGAQAGLAWLQRALHGACETADQACGPAATLEVFTSCPGPITPTANLLLPPVQATYLHPNDPTMPSYDWTVTGGTFTAPVDGATVLVPDDTGVVTDGGLSTTVVLGETIDSGGAAGTPGVNSGGVARPEPANALLAGSVAVCTDGPVTITWSLRNEAPGPASVQLVIVDDSGQAVEFGPKVDLTGTLQTYVWDLPFGVDHDTWRPGLVAGYPVAVASVVTSTYTDTSPQDCVAPYQRFLPNTVTTSGPLVVQEVDAGCAVLLKVEWTWVVGSPYRYGVTTPVLAGLSADTDPTLVRPGVSWARATGDPAPVVVDTCDTANGWAATGGAAVGAVGGNVAVFGSFAAPVVSRTGDIDVTTRRFLAIDWQQYYSPGYLPGMSVTDSDGEAANLTLVSTTIGQDGRTRSVFSLPSSVGDTITRFTWYQTNGDASDVVLYFAQVSTQTVAAPTSATIPATPWDCAPPAPELSCAADPCSPGFTAPPTLPFVTDPNRPRITTQDVHDTWVCVGPEQSPANDGVFTISLTADTQPVVGARVRVWDNPTGSCEVDDTCDFAYEYLIDYIPAGGILTIDGVDDQITTLCDGGNVLADASGSVAGSYGGPTVTPVARCNRRYLIRVQWLAVYPRTCPTVYTAGQPQGNVTIGVAVTPREG